MRRGSLAAIAALMTTFAAAGTAEALVCVRATASGTGLTPQIATNIARQSLATYLTQQRLRPRNAITINCTTNFPLTTCRASQVACR